MPDDPTVFQPKQQSWKLESYVKILDEGVSLDIRDFTPKIFLRDHHLLCLQNFPKKKKNISYPVRRTRMCACQGVRNVSFSENFANVLNE